MPGHDSTEFEVVVECLRNFPPVLAFSPCIGVPFWRRQSADTCHPANLLAVFGIHMRWSRRCMTRPMHDCWIWISCVACKHQLREHPLVCYSFQLSCSLPMCLLNSARLAETIHANKVLFLWPRRPPYWWRARWVRPTFPYIKVTMHEWHRGWSRRERAEAKDRNGITISKAKLYTHMRVVRRNNYVRQLTKQ